MLWRCKIRALEQDAELVVDSVSLSWLLVLSGETCCSFVLPPSAAAASNISTFSRQRASNVEGGIERPFQEILGENDKDELTGTGSLLRKRDISWSKVVMLVCRCSCMVDLWRGAMRLCPWLSMPIAHKSNVILHRTCHPSTLGSLLHIGLSPGLQPEQT